MAMNNPFASDLSGLTAGIDAYFRARDQSMREQQHDRELMLREQEARQKAEEHRLNLEMKRAEIDSKIAEREEKKRLEGEKRSQAKVASKAVARQGELEVEQPMFPQLRGYGMPNPDAAMGGWATDETAEAPGYQGGMAGGVDLALRGMAKQTEDSDYVKEIEALMLGPNAAQTVPAYIAAAQRKKATQAGKDKAEGRLDIDWWKARNRGSLDWAKLEQRRAEWAKKAAGGRGPGGKDWPKYMAAGQSFMQRGQSAEKMAQADIDDANRGVTMRDMLGNFTGVQRILAPAEQEEMRNNAAARIEEARSLYGQADEFFTIGSTRAGVKRVERPGKDKGGGAATPTGPVLLIDLKGNKFNADPKKIDIEAKLKAGWKRG